MFHGHTARQDGKEHERREDDVALGPERQQDERDGEEAVSPRHAPAGSHGGDDEHGEPDREELALIGAQARRLPLDDPTQHSAPRQEVERKANQIDAVGVHEHYGARQERPDRDAPRRTAGRRHAVEPGSHEVQSEVGESQLERAVHVRPDPHDRRDAHRRGATGT